MTTRHIVSAISEQGNVLQSSVWSTEKPLTLGHPFRWILEQTESGIRVRDLKTLEVKHYQNNHPQIQLDSKLRINIHPVTEVIPPTLKEASWTQFESIQEIDPHVFKKILKRSLAFLFAVLFLIQVVPKSKPDEKELIPAQFAKVILQPARPKGTPSKVRESSKPVVNVVQTLKSTQVQKSTQSLLKASMVSLLARTTPFSISNSGKKLGALFKNQKTKNLKLDSSTGGKDKLAKMEVQGFGGKASDKGAVGYADGSHAAVSGQGNVMVALDTLESSVAEGLTKDEVGRVIHQHISEIRYCYESAMIRNPAIQGKLVVNFVIHPSPQIRNTGTVKTAKVNSSTLEDTSLDQCIISRLARWKFPKPRGGVEVAVAYPFIFKSLGR